MFYLKLTPGTEPAVFDAVLEAGYKGFIVEGFGTGGVHSIRKDLPSKLSELAKKGIPGVLKGQCLYGKSDLEVYEVGKNALYAGVIRAYDQTSEAAFAKLKCLLSTGLDAKSIKEVFETNIAGEMQK